MSDDPKATSNFIRHIIEGDEISGKFAARHWQGKPGLGAEQMAAAPDPARIRTRFPPEPNGYLHLGHAKSIFLNFGLARAYAGACHMRFDDTNPEKEEQEYVDSILDAVRWLGFDWNQHLYYASDYFDWMFACALSLIQSGHAYVDSQTADEIRALRGTLTEPGQNSPFRDRGVDENINLFTRMQAGEFADGAHVLRAKIDMASGNINLRDPVIYRIRHAAHHRAGDAWRVYPLYTFAHPIEDALENITHSICTLEFEAQRPFYDWLLNTLADNGLFARPLPQQIEFARLNLTYIVLSKRKLIQLVDEKHVSGWDDPRLPTLVGARRRGYSPAGFKLFTDRIGVSKSDGWIDYSVFEDAQREVLNTSAPRRIAVLDPLKLIIDNYPDDQSEECFAPNHPQQPELGKRAIPFSKELWIEREDFSEAPPKGYFRLFPPRLDATDMMQPGNSVRLRYGFVITCTDVEHAADGTILAVHCNYLPETKSGTPGSDGVKVKGNIHWVSAAHAFAAEVRLYDRLFNVARPGTASGNFLDDLNPDSVTTITAQLEPALRDARTEDSFQFERHGYFVADRRDSQPDAPVFNRTVTLKDSWAKTDK